MGFGTLGPAIGQGFVAGKACESLGKRPESANIIFRTMMAGMAMIEASAIYALIVALILLFVI
jgi:F-type H+-transporting ATPase subunit c